LKPKLSVILQKQALFESLDKLMIKTKFTHSQTFKEINPLTLPLLLFQDPTDDSNEPEAASAE
jgi:hypothetical protein